MRYFDDRSDVDEWLDPLYYEEFWREVSTFSLDIMTREYCDEQIAQGIVSQETVLYVMKGFVRLQVIEQQKLPARITVPWTSLH